MQLSTYHCNDLNTYLGGTFITLEDKPSFIENIDLLDSDNNVVPSEYSHEATSARLHLLRAKGKTLTHTHVVVPYNSNLPTIPVLLGYYDIGKSVVFFYHVQGRNYKKLPNLNSIQSFNPQSKELEYLGTRDTYIEPSKVRELLLHSAKYTPLEEAYSLLTTKERFAVSLHKNYALVKKGRYQHPVIYFKTDPVITYDGSDLTPLIDECHITKFRLEVLS